MSTITDANAAREPERVWGQHQAALLFLQAMLADPKVRLLRWLDLACGRGQIVSNLPRALSLSARSKLHYEGYDVHLDYTREVESRVSQMSLRSYKCEIGEISNFHKIYQTQKFDFVTFINAAHELRPNDLALVFSEGISLLSSRGQFFGYDVESPNPMELGAIPWARDEIGEILKAICREFGVPQYQPEISWWPHQSGTAWSLHVNRAHMHCAVNELSKRRGSAREAAMKTMRNLLEGKLASVKEQLIVRTHGPLKAEGDDMEARRRLLNDYWALSHVLAESAESKKDSPRKR